MSLLHQTCNSIHFILKICIMSKSLRTEQRWNEHIKICSCNLKMIGSMHTETVVPCSHSALKSQGCCMLWTCYGVNVTIGVSVPREVTVGSRKKTETERNITFTRAGLIQVPVLPILLRYLCGVSSLFRRMLTAGWERTLCISIITGLSMRGWK